MSFDLPDLLETGPFFEATNVFGKVVFVSFPKSSPGFINPSFQTDIPYLWEETARQFFLRAINSGYKQKRAFSRNAQAYQERRGIGSTSRAESPTSWYQVVRWREFSRFSLSSQATFAIVRARSNRSSGKPEKNSRRGFCIPDRTKPKWLLHY